MGKQTSDRLTLHAAQRARRRRFFLASALSEYRSLHKVSEEELAEFLGCSLPALPKLALCRRPNTGLLSFRSEAERIASYVGANSFRVGQLLREIESLAALRGAPRHTTADRGDGLLLAARDRPEEERPEAKETQEPPENDGDSHEK